MFVLALISKKKACINNYNFLKIYRLGCPGFTVPVCDPTPVETGASKSLFFPDQAINKHPRFR